MRTYWVRLTLFCTAHRLKSNKTRNKKLNITFWLESLFASHFLNTVIPTQRWLIRSRSMAIRQCRRNFFRKLTDMESTIEVVYARWKGVDLYSVGHHKAKASEVRVTKTKPEAKVPWYHELFLYMFMFTRAVDLSEHTQNSTVQVGSRKIVSFLPFTSSSREASVMDQYCSACHSQPCQCRSEGRSLARQPRHRTLAELCKTVVLLALRVPRLESVQKLPLPRRERDKLASVIRVVFSAHFNEWLKIWYNRFPGRKQGEDEDIDEVNFRRKLLPASAMTWGKNRHKNFVLCLISSRKRFLWRKTFFFFFLPRPVCSRCTSLFFPDFWSCFSAFETIVSSRFEDFLRSGCSSLLFWEKTYLSAKSVWWSLIGWILSQIRTHPCVGIAHRLHELSAPIRCSLLLHFTG